MQDSNKPLLRALEIQIRRFFHAVNCCVHSQRHEQSRTNTTQQTTGEI